MKNPVYFFITLLLIMGCKKEVSITTETFDLSHFNSIEIKNSFEVEIIEGPNFKLEISTENANNIEKVEYEIVEDELIISDKRKLKFLKPGQFTYLKIHAPEFYLIKLKGGVTLTNRGELTSNEIGVIFKDDYNFCDFTLNNNIFYFWNELEAGGEIKLTGNTETVKFWFKGLVNIDSKNALAKEAIIHSNSRIDSDIYASQKIDCEIVGEGNVNLYGNPSLIINQSEGENKNKLIIK